MLHSLTNICCISFDHLTTQVVEVEGGVGYSLVGDDANVYGLKLDGQLGEGGVNDSIGRGFAHEVRGSYDGTYHSVHHSICSICISHISSKLFRTYALQDKDKTTVKSKGAGPLLPVRGIIVGTLKMASMPFTKMLKKQSKPKHLDAFQPSSAVDAEPTLGGSNVDTLQAVKVRGIPFVALLFSP